MNQFGTNPGGGYLPVSLKYLEIMEKEVKIHREAHLGSSPAFEQECSQVVMNCRVNSVLGCPMVT